MPVTRTQTLSQQIARRMLPGREPEKIVKPAKEADTPPLGLDKIEPGEMPKIEVILTNKGDILANIETSVNALIVSPDRRILYLESVCSSDSTAHAIMGCIVDDFGAKEWRYYPPNTTKHHAIVQPPKNGTCNDTVDRIPGFDRRVHHIAIVEKSGDLILAKDQDALWQRVRTNMSCPTLNEWRDGIMPHVISTGVLIPCEMFGIDKAYMAFVMADKASERFDAIVSKHVKQIGGIPRRK